MKKDNDFRIEKLSSLIKGVFVTLLNSYKTDDKNKGTVIRGDGKKEVSKCTFTIEYKEHFQKLFEITFAFKNYDFEYKGKRVKEENFSRDIAIRNAIAFFEKQQIDINYTFYSCAEQNLFSKLIFSFYKILINVLFVDYTNHKDDEKLLNEIVEEKYNKALKTIRDRVNSSDIISLIYANAKKNEIEQIKDSHYNDSECTDAYFIKIGTNVSEIMKANYIHKDIRLQLKEDIVYDESVKNVETDNSLYPYSDTSEFTPLPLKGNVNFQQPENHKYISINVWKSYDREYFFPSYCCFITCHPKLLNDIEKKRNSRDCEEIFSEYSYNKLQSEIHCRVISEIQEKFKYSKKQSYIDLMKNIEDFIGYNYIKYFEISRNLHKEIRPGYLKFKSFLEKNRFKSINPKVLYIYLISTLIDEFCHTLEIFSVDEMFEYIDKNDSVLKNHLKRIKGYIEGDYLKNVISKYDIFYNEYHDDINIFLESFAVMQDSCWESMIDSSKKTYNPFRYLKNSIKKYYNNFIGKRDDVYYDILNTSESVEENKTDVEDKTHDTIIFENGKTYCFEFEASGDSNNPFSCMIITKKTDGSIQTVFECDNINLDNSFRKYSYTFTYSGETVDTYFLAFGFKNDIYGYRIQKVRIYIT